MSLNECENIICMTENKKERTRGRSEMNDDIHMSVIAQFRVMPYKRDQLEAGAKKAGKKLSNWLREGVFQPYEP
jgi:hypothetical protein